VWAECGILFSAWKPPCNVHAYEAYLWCCQHQFPLGQARRQGYKVQLKAPQQRLILWLTNWMPMLKQKESCDVSNHLSALECHPPNSLLSGSSVWLGDHFENRSLLALVGSKRWLIADAGFHNLRHNLRGALFFVYASMCILVIFSYPDFLAAEAQQKFAKCSPKLLIAEAINDGVTNRMPILEPFTYRKNHYWHFWEPLTPSSYPHLNSTHRKCKIEGEKWCPADEKKTDDNSHCCSNAQILKSTRMMLFSRSKA